MVKNTIGPVPVFMFAIVLMASTAFAGTNCINTLGSNISIGNRRDQVLVNANEIIIDLG